MHIRILQDMEIGLIYLSNGLDRYLCPWLFQKIPGHHINQQKKLPL